MSIQSLQNLRFCLLPSANPPHSAVALHNNAFQLWQDVWTKMMTNLNCSTANLTDEFIRQDIVACIADGDTPVAVHLYSFFATDSVAARKHGYFASNYPELYFARLAKERVRNVMSMEYMTVHPDWRKDKAIVHVGAALGGLAIRSMHYFGADAAIAPCRRDHKIHEMAYNYGGEPVIANVVNHNVPCDLVMVKRKNVKAHASAEVQSLLEHLWQKREYYPAFQPARDADILQFPAKKEAA